MTIHVVILVSIASLENACVELNQVAKEKEQDLIAMLWAVHVNALERLILVRTESIVTTENAAVKVWLTLLYYIDYNIVIIQIDAITTII